jgi:hypothetical protein
MRNLIDAPGGVKRQRQLPKGFERCLTALHSAARITGLGGRRFDLSVVNKIIRLSFLEKARKVMARRRKKQLRRLIFEDTSSWVCDLPT